MHELHAWCWQPANKLRFCHKYLDTIWSQSSLAHYPANEELEAIQKVMFTASDLISLIYPNGIHTQPRPRQMGLEAESVLACDFPQLFICPSFAHSSAYSLQCIALRGALWPSSQLTQFQDWTKSPWHPHIETFNPLDADARCWGYFNSTWQAGYVLKTDKCPGFHLKNIPGSLTLAQRLL